MSDVDGDSTMRSSPSLDDNDDDEMFPDESVSNNTNAVPSTPQHARLAAGSELSPPHSQTQPRDLTSLSLNANGKRPLSLAQSGAAPAPAATHRDPETGYQWTKQEEQPGWEWKNPRAREDEQRALDVIIDRGHQVKLRYGDPLDPSVAPVATRKR